MKSILSRIFAIFVFLTCVTLAVALVFEFATPRRVQKSTVTILRGENAFQIANDLKAEGYINNKLFFLFNVVKNGNLKKLKSGEYDFGGLGYAAIIDKLTKAQTIAKTITVIPGWSFLDIRNYLAESEIIKADDFTDEANPLLLKEFDFLNDPAAGGELEGFLYPDTYQVPDKPSADDIKKLMLENFDAKLTDSLRVEINKQRRTVFEIVTMASLLEREVKTSEDKKLVAGILWKRMETEMPLQVDSTLLYYKTGSPEIFNKDINSPYNTYKYAGLPAGPICNPGIESIEAAVYPKNSDYWYYLNAKDGTTIFSKTYDEHLANKTKYLK